MATNYAAQNMEPGSTGLTAVKAGGEIFGGALAGAAFGPLMLLALFWRRTNLAGAVSGMLVGAVTCFVWKFVLSDMAAEHPIFGLYELAPGFVLAFVATVAVSLLTGRPPKEIEEEFDAVAKAA